MSSENVKKVFELLKEHTISDIHKWENKYIEFQGIYNDIPFEVCDCYYLPLLMVKSLYCIIY